MAKSAKQKLRNRADKLLQDYIREHYKNELCWVCGEKPIVCGHHFIPVSNSLVLRYYLPNLIPICQNCHYLAHAQPHLVNPKICFKLGQGWYEHLLETKRHPVKFTKGWITRQLEILGGLFEELKIL